VAMHDARREPTHQQPHHRQTHVFLQVFDETYAKRKTASASTTRDAENSNTRCSLLSA
jgi:hypothetical protein